MNVLVACEESQAVCTEARRLGHNAFSCDIQECSGGHPEWHILGDVLPLLNGRCSFESMDGAQHEITGRWDTIIAFPPCTKVSNAGARHLYRGGQLNIPRYYEGLCGKALWMAIWAANCERVCIENPTPSKIFGYPEPTQKIQPWQFGSPWTKLTLLWERGLAPLVPTDIVEPVGTLCPSGGDGSYRHRSNPKHRGMIERDYAINRSKTPPGLAKAMAEQWLGDVTKGEPS